MIYTIGHSTRSFEEFLGLLEAHRIDRLADVRTIPRSRRHPHFAAEQLSSALREAGIEYRHFPALGGLRKPRADSTNSAWRNDGFRGYADYMETDAFRRGLLELVDWSGTGRAAIMCAEAVWWRCHRQLISDALVARGIDVGHILSPAPVQPHELTEFARLADEEVRYPGLI